MIFLNVTSIEYFVYLLLRMKLLWTFGVVLCRVDKYDTNNFKRCVFFTLRSLFLTIQLALFAKIDLIKYAFTGLGKNVTRFGSLQTIRVLGFPSGYIDNVQAKYNLVWYILTRHLWNRFSFFTFAYYWISASTDLFMSNLQAFMLISGGLSRIKHPIKDIPTLFLLYP